VIPVADIRGVDTLNYTKGEKLFRCKLASCYRLLDLFGWTDDVTSGCVTARLDDESNDQLLLLVAPHGLMCDEVTASSLIKLTMGSGGAGEVLDPGSSGLDVNPQSLGLHSVLYTALKRTDIKCVIHLTSVSAVTVSTMKCGLMPLCPEAMAVGGISYSDYCGCLLDRDDRDNLAEALGPTNKVLFLRNYGVVVCGGSIEESFLLAFNVMSAVEMQLNLAVIGLENIHIPSDEMCRTVYENGFRPPSGAAGTKRRWRRGELEFEAMMRQLDLAGYQTGYAYRPVPSGRLCRSERSNSDAELGGSALVTSSSFGGSDYELAAKFGSPLRAPRLSVDRQMTPNTYQQIVARGSEPAKKITKWVPVDVTPIPRSPVPPNKVEKPNLFAPQGINPAELKEKVKAIRKDYYTDKVTAGPQSKILEGINWDEAQAMKDSFISGTSDNISSPPVVVASKAVIQREHQHGTTLISKTLFYPPNPFNRMSEDDIEEYRSTVEKRSRSGSVEPSGLSDQLEPNPPGRLVSTEERLEMIRREQDMKSDQVKVQDVHGGSAAGGGDGLLSQQEAHAQIVSLDTGTSESEQ
jgi:adducin